MKYLKNKQYNPIHNSIKTIEYLEINLTKEVKDLHTKNYKTLMKEIEDTNKSKDISCSSIGRIDIIKMPILPQITYRVNRISTKIPIAFFTEIEKTILKFVWNPKRSQIVKAIPREKNNVGGITLPDSKLYYKSIITKIV